MRRSAFVMLIAGSIASVYGVAARGSETSGAAGRPPAASAKPSAGVLARFDANRDGTLDAAERAVMRKDIQDRIRPLRDATLKQYDVNRNGRLDDDERLALEKDDQARHEKVEKWALGRYDADKNGVLDAAEQQVRKATREEWLRKKQSQVLETFDANRNGMLDPEEKAVIRQKSDAAKQTALDLYDSNRDGRLDEAERAVATGTRDTRRTGRAQTAAGAVGSRPEAGASGEASALAVGPPLSSMRVTPAGGTSYAQGAEIVYTLGSAAPVTVRIHDAAGRLVRVLASGRSEDAGARALHWDGNNGGGHAVSNGLYLVTVEVPGGKATAKVAFIR